MKENIDPLDNSYSKCNIHEVYYSFGNYIYNTIQPTISGDLNIFKYILGKYYYEYLFPI